MNVAAIRPRQGLGARHVLALVGCFFACFSSMPASSADDPVFEIEFRDGVVKPDRIEAPANKRFILVLHNRGNAPAEFESIELKKEKVLSPGASSELVIRDLDPGEYKFFDDFHPGAPSAVIIAR